MSNVVVLDLDDTMADMKSAMYKILNEINPEVQPPHTWNDFKVEVRNGISWETVQAKIIERNILEQLQPHVAAANFTKSLKNIGKEVRILTARAWHPRGLEITKDWLDRNNFHVDRIDVVPISICKSDYVNSEYNSNILAFVDDRVEHCRAVRDKSNIKKVYLFSQPWNSSETNIPRISCYTSLIKEIQEN